MSEGQAPKPQNKGVLRLFIIAALALVVSGEGNTVTIGIVLLLAILCTF